MILWLDENLPPSLAPWLAAEFGVAAVVVRDLSLAAEKDEEIFWSARANGAVILTKDTDYVELLQKHGPPPAIVHVQTGNQSNVRLRAFFRQKFALVLHELRGGTALVQITE
jgi:predicted nuclease of predicted toxin-antitoxin system